MYCLFNTFFVNTIVYNLLLKYFFFFFFYCRYNPLWVLAFSVILFHSVLSLHNFMEILIAGNLSQVFNVQNYP